MSKRSRQVKIEQHQYVGLDVSLAETSIAVVNESGRMLWRGKVDTTPEAIAEALQLHALLAERIGLEAGQLSSWLYQSLKALGLPVICVDARHAKAALSLRLNKTDPNDALGLAEIMRVGWYREVVVKGQVAQALRALLVARAQLVSQVTTLKNCVRGLLKIYGIVLPKKLRAGFVAGVREAIAEHTTLEPVLDPMLCTISGTVDQLHAYDRAVHRHARDDDTIRHLMTAPGVGPIVAMAYATAVDTPARFARSSSVGVYFGMTPRRYQSGEVDTAGRISRCGDGMVRGLLYEAAKVLLARSAKPSDLQAWGRKLARRIGTKKATVAVARKLSVILHRMWTTGEPFRWTAAPAPTTA